MKVINVSKIITIFLVGMCFLNSGCKTRVLVDHNNSPGHGKVIYISDSIGVIEHCHKKQASTFLRSEYPNIRYGDLVSFIIRTVEGDVTTENIKIEDNSHGTRYWHFENPLHVRGHIYPKSNKETELFNNRYYIKVEFVFVQAETEREAEDTREDTWIPLDYYESKDFKTQSVHFVGMLRDVSGNDIKLKGHRLGYEVLKNHPVH